MSQHDINIANQGFPAFRADLNNALGALVSNSSGATEPSTTYAYQLWYDETTDTLKIRNSDDDAWITLFTFDQANDTVEVSGEELVDDTTPQLGGDLASNGNDIIMADNDKVLLGTGSDGELFHNGSNTIINDAGTGTLQLQTGGTTHLEVTANGLSVTGQAVQGTVTDQTDDDIDFDMQDGNHFTVSFGASSATDFAFTNETEGQAGMIFLTTEADGVGNITIGADVHLSDADLTAINVAGNYIISYYCPDGTNVYLSASAALTEGS